VHQNGKSFQCRTLEVLHSNQAEPGLHPEVSTKQWQFTYLTVARRWLSASPVNNSAWIAIVVRIPRLGLGIYLTGTAQDAEMAALLGDPNSLRLYDVAVR
jgi:hypothetical protein